MVARPLLKWAMKFRHLGVLILYITQRLLQLQQPYIASIGVTPRASAASIIDDFVDFTVFTSE